METLTEFMERKEITDINSNTLVEKLIIQSKLNRKIKRRTLLQEVDQIRKTKDKYKEMIATKEMLKREEERIYIL